ncbi:NAD-dependent succinate-semialdehyde dehydrogenase [Dermatophilus congolensis]|uniref:NAD-dependent succinate-semialdehyde dehydrogenase n=1 Tax=Dermatophilus congolensis TaxID=1863 RepID=UPI001AAF00EA|nr:NAD-dependent succinate-semialdehyde dehydrogenase [Dermatophilus congolensis]MBO3143759.1 NAD-dependent succinate-semialdehyde dehydrogenase [Dermatophilus congolensis]MBO3152750.1 NAD-dependent succinate-semialdehyde dehydrogenase [Dermatophilus congolensis]MBO3160239.1 NAD-dependent succinate-semialdehyde dehydrogenase [Dermatophilus congolensis]MBO3164035.1 NAD-dependent succinate-semialdehyde dehydrogenase [Dermatophilus congolensis]MBO3177580.1 NAD-dependent succinate-semialdehyde deh
MSTQLVDRSLPADLPRGIFVGGSWREGARGVVDVENPATGEVLAQVANCDVAQGVEALDAAVDAAAAWARTSSRDRGELLRRAFEAVTARADDFARLMTLEMGKPLAEARGEVAYGAEFLRWFSEEAPRVSGSYRPSPGGAMRHLVTKRPVGPCLLITPWNFPLAMATRKVAPALAAGCTVVLRPATLTPLTTLLFAKVLADCGLPAGVVNVVTSVDHDVTDALIADPRLRKLSFTGSTGVGRTLLKQAAQGVLRTSMELGGNAPFIVFEDADLDVAVEAATAAKLRNMGEACTAANRFIVHESIADEFASRLAEAFSQLRVGDGLADGTDVGPLVSEGARAGVASLVDAAIAEGASVLTGGKQVEGAGWFYAPTVLSGVGKDAAIVGEEIFGPVAPVVSFSDEAEALEIANRSEVGLAGYVFTRDMDRVLRMGDVLEVGMIGVNRGVLSDAAAPFGGVKQAGLGREGGGEGIEEYLETIYLSLNDPHAG